MPDPCPHITRMDLIAAKLAPDYELDRILDHLDNCQGGFHPDDYPGSKPEEA